MPTREEGVIVTETEPTQFDHERSRMSKMGIPWRAEGGVDRVELMGTMT